MNKALLGALLIILAFAGCSKTTDVTSVEDGIIGTWRRTAGNYVHRSAYTHQDTTVDYWTKDSSCRKDDALEFQAGYKGLLHLGSNVCNAGDPESIAFHWEVTGGGTGIDIYDAPEYFPVTLDVTGAFVAITSGFMSVKYQKVVVNDVTHTEDTIKVTDVFRKQ